MKKLLIILSISVFIQSCDISELDTDKISDQVNVSTTVALPLVKSNVTLGEMFYTIDGAKDFLKEDANGFLRLKIENPYARIGAREFFADLIGALPPGTNEVPIAVLQDISFTVKPTIYNLGFDKLKNLRGFQFKDPSVVLKIDNYWALPVQVKLDKAGYHVDKGSPLTPFTGSGIDKWHSIKSPQTAGSFVTTSITLNRTNSNFADVMKDMPNNMELGMLCKTLPEAVGNTYRINLNSRNNINIGVDAPMEVKIDNITFKDTLDFDMGSNLDKEGLVIKYANVNIIFDNAMPLGAKIKISLADNSYNVLDVLTDENVDVKAGTSTNGTNSAIQSLIEINVEGDKTEKLKKTKKLIFDITMNTKDSEYVKLYSQYSLGVKVGVKAETEYKN